jgi:hypothetical protein
VWRGELLSHSSLLVTSVVMSVARSTLV